MATSTQIKSDNNTLIRVKTTAKSITKTNVADQLDASIDYTVQELALKVDKVAGERLVNTTEITKLANLSGTNTGDQDISGKENTSNKSTNVTTDASSDTKYPSVKAVKTYVDANGITYKIYTAFLEFVDASTILSTVFENTIGNGSKDGINDIAWSYNSGSQPKAVMTNSPFTNLKTLCSNSIYNVSMNLQGIRISNQECIFYSSDINTGASSLSFVPYVFVEIRVYN